MKATLLRFPQMIHKSTVTGRLGYSRTGTTLNIYAEFLQSADKAASDCVSNATFGKKDGA